MRNRLAATIVILLIPQLAWAGGQEIPDNGAQALSRGGAFTAKADDLTALQYNVAGLAWVRGTRLLVSANIINASADFQRAGTYPPNGQPWDNQPFPKVSNSGGPFFAPMLLAASDFGTRTWTFAAGVYGPSAYGSAKFPTTVRLNGANAPAPQRYDFLEHELLVAYPTAAVAFRPWQFLSVGAAFHWVYSSLKFHQITYLTAARSGDENPDWDYDVHLDVSDGFEPSASAGALLAPNEHWQLGVNWRYSTDIDASGTATASTGPNPPEKPKPMYDNGQYAVVSSFRTGLPMIVRAGGRYIFRRGAFEAGDLELDFVWENWSAKVQDIQIKTTGVSPQPALILSPHRYNDSYSVRLGGAYNFESPNGLWSLRAGSYYDSAAAPDEWTRLDFRAWDHLGFTAGLGWQAHGLSANLGAAYVYMPDRTVTNSLLRQTHTLGGSISDPSYTVVGNGTYSASYVILTFGLEYKFDPFR